MKSLCSVAWLRALSIAGLAVFGVSLPLVVAVPRAAAATSLIGSGFFLRGTRSPAMDERYRKVSV